MRVDSEINRREAAVGTHSSLSVRKHKAYFWPDRLDKV